MRKVTVWIHTESDNYCENCRHYNVERCFLFAPHQGDCTDLDYDRSNGKPLRLKVCKEAEKEAHRK
jgi:hypothetical protein